MGQKKIILLATSDINYDQRVQKIASTLHSLGADVHVKGRIVASSIPLIEKPYRQSRVKCFFQSGMMFYLEINIRFFLHLLANSYDIVCANDPDTLLAALKATVFKKIDLVYDSHEYFTEVPELEGKKFKKSIWKSIERKGVNKAKRCYTVNESIAEILHKQYAKKVEVVRNVPPLAPFIEIEKREKFILYQGALNKGRGLEQLIEAMKNIPLKLKIAGKGDLEKNLKLQVLHLELSANVEFVGNLLPKDLKKLTDEAWLGINLLESKSLNYYYSLANKFFDYMHAEIPSLNMAFPEYENILAKHEVGLALKSLDAQGIAEAINGLNFDRKEYNRLKSNCKHAKEQFNWQKESRKLKEMYGL